MTNRLQLVSMLRPVMEMYGRSGLFAALPLGTSALARSVGGWDIVARPSAKVVDRNHEADPPFKTDAGGGADEPNFTHGGVTRFNLDEQLDAMRRLSFLVLTIATPPTPLGSRLDGPMVIEMPRRSSGAPEPYLVTTTTEGRDREQAAAGLRAVAMSFPVPA